VFSKEPFQIRRRSEKKSTTLILYIA